MHEADQRRHTHRRDDRDDRQHGELFNQRETAVRTHGRRHQQPAGVFWPALLMVIVPLRSSACPPTGVAVAVKRGGASFGSSVVR
jgi:hypothetical protein